MIEETITSIPELAMPVVEVLRRDVPPPKELPYIEGGTLGFGLFHACPRNLHAQQGGIMSEKEVPQASRDAFYRWWDSLSEKDILSACIVIWPDFKGEKE